MRVFDYICSETSFRALNRELRNKTSGDGSNPFSRLFSFDFLQDQQHTERVMAALEKICLHFLGTNPERRAVIRRLERQNTHSIGGLLQLHRGEVSEWPGVGSVFLTIFDEMREEVHADPEGIVTKWINERAPLTFPKDLNQLHPFEITDNQLFADSESTTPHQLNENAHSFLTPTSTEEDCFAEIIEIECVFTEIIHLLQTRIPDLAEMVRRFYLEGLSPEVIANILRLRSAVVVTHEIEHVFLRPLLNGETLSNLSLDEDFPKRMTLLRDRLLMMPVEPLTSLTAMLPERFLHLLGLTVMTRSAAEFTWAGDLIVPIGDIYRHTQNVARHTDLFTTRSFVRFARKIAADLLPRMISDQETTNQIATITEEKRLEALLQHHPWIEQGEKGVRLISEQLLFDYCRIARILADAHRPLEKDEILTRYERCYFERPSSISVRLLRKHFPNIQIPQTGAWSWEN